MKKLPDFIEDDLYLGEQDDYASEIGPGIFVSLFLVAVVVAIVTYAILSLVKAWPLI